MSLPEVVRLLPRMSLLLRPLAHRLKILRPVLGGSTSSHNRRPMAMGPGGGGKAGGGGGGVKGVAKKIKVGGVLLLT